jgi:hypothetical protein
MGTKTARDSIVVSRREAKRRWRMRPFKFFWLLVCWLAEERGGRGGADLVFLGEGVDILVP